MRTPLSRRHCAERPTTRRGPAGGCAGVRGGRRLQREGQPRARAEAAGAQLQLESQRRAAQRRQQQQAYLERAARGSERADTDSQESKHGARQTAAAARERTVGTPGNAETAGCGWSRRAATNRGIAPRCGRRARCRCICRQAGKRGAPVVKQSRVLGLSPEFGRAGALGELGAWREDPAACRHKQRHSEAATGSGAAVTVKQRATKNRGAEGEPHAEAKRRTPGQQAVAGRRTRSRALRHSRYARARAPNSVPSHVMPGKAPRAAAPRRAAPRERAPADRLATPS